MANAKQAKKSNRCWPGYTPVAGKEPHEQGSCRPKADSKSTPSERDFKKKRRRQLDEWEKEHPGKSRSGARHLHAPGQAARKKTASRKKSSGGSRKPRAKSRSGAKARRPAA